MEILKYIVCGDPQGDVQQTKKVVDFVNSIPSSGLDFMAFAGDIMGSESTIRNYCKVQYYLAQGNHDGSNFGPQYYANIKGYQLVIPQFDWKKYNWSQVDKTRPCIVIVHCPPIPCSECDSLHKCGIGMIDEQLNKLNMRACHSGHLHGHKVDIIDNRLYVVESGMPNRTTCCSPNFRNQVGYVKIDNNGKVCYKELDITKPWTDQIGTNGEVLFDATKCTGGGTGFYNKCVGGICTQTSGTGIDECNIIGETCGGSVISCEGCDPIKNYCFVGVCVPKNYVLYGGIGLGAIIIIKILMKSAYRRDLYPPRYR